MCVMGKRGVCVCDGKERGVRVCDGKERGVGVCDGKERGVRVIFVHVVLHSHRRKCFQTRIMEEGCFATRLSCPQWEFHR